jgi:hypothetical protein
VVRAGHAVPPCSTLLTVKRTILACAPGYLYKLAMPTILTVCTGAVHAFLSIMHNGNTSSRRLPLKEAKKRSIVTDALQMGIFVAQKQRAV